MINEKLENLSLISYSLSLKVTWAKGRYDFSPDEYSFLLGISNQSPYTGGPVVYTARVMLGLEPGNMQQRSEEITPNDSSETQDIPVFGKPYPNPANDQINLNYYLPEGETAEFDIYNLSGQIINRYELNSGSGILSFSTGKYSEGMYIYNIHDNNKLFDRGKIVILKNK